MKLGELIIVLITVGIIGAIFDAKVSKWLNQIADLKLQVSGLEATVESYKSNLQQCLIDVRIDIDDLNDD